MFRFSTAGESHGKAIVALIEGLPAGLPIDLDFVNHQLWRRQQGYGRGNRMKIEQDRVEVLSGVRHGQTLGSPISLIIYNKDFPTWEAVMAVEPQELDDKKARRVTRPRPGHADLSGGQKYDRHDLRDILERSSARETTMRVAAGGFARLLLRTFDIELASHTVMLGGIPEQAIADIEFERIKGIPDDSPVRCVDEELQARMVALIDEAKQAGDTLGGTFEVVARNVPVGLGSHIQWDLKLDGRLAQAVMSINAVKAVEVGAGVDVSRRPGSQIHDEIWYNSDLKEFFRRTNRAGGIEGGMSNGAEIRVRGHLKPIPTLRKALQSVDINTKEPFEAAFERSDVTVLPAAGVIGEAMVALTLTEAFCEKFGGDSLSEMKRNYDGYLEQLRNY